MKLEYKSTDKNPMSSIYVKRIQKPYLGENWHFHEEFELIYFLEGSGVRIVGDHISNFQKGELVLVGQWLPHLWRNDEKVDGPRGADFIVVKFPRTLLGVDIFSLPELVKVRSLLKKSIRGILFDGTVEKRVRDLLLKLNEGTSSARIILFLQVLDILSQESSFKPLTSPDFTLPKEVSSENRLQMVISHIFEHYTEEIKLNDIANLACMTSPAFCRFFKARTNKTFFNFLNEFRINKACQLLIDGEIPVNEICYKTGFRSMTNFNRTFKRIKEVTPSAYRDNFRTFKRTS